MDLRVKSADLEARMGDVKGVWMAIGVVLLSLFPTPEVFTSQIFAFIRPEGGEIRPFNAGEPLGLAPKGGLMRWSVDRVRASVPKRSGAPGASSEVSIVRVIAVLRTARPEGQRHFGRGEVRVRAIGKAETGVRAAGGRLVVAFGHRLRVLAGGSEGGGPTNQGQDA